MSTSTKTEKFTPGPWDFLESKGGSWFVYPPDRDEENVTHPLRPVVKVPKRGTKEMIANARLISAAPELLEALEDIIQHCGYAIPTALEGYAKGAIAKAKGEL